MILKGFGFVAFFASVEASSEDDIEIDIKETGREGVMWFHLAKVRTWWRFPVNTLINLRVPNLRHRVPGSECFKVARCPHFRA
jgi:hypothetical protein